MTATVEEVMADSNLAAMLERGKAWAQRERRERIATAIAAGMVAAPLGSVNYALRHDSLSIRAVMLADALMAELDKEG